MPLFRCRRRHATLLLYDDTKNGSVADYYSDCPIYEGCAEMTLREFEDF